MFYTHSWDPWMEQLWQKSRSEKSDNAKLFLVKLVEYIDVFFLFTENLIDSTHVSIRLNFCFSCLFSLKHLTWTVLPCIHPKFVTREVFSHSSSEGGEILGPSSLQNYLQLWAEGCVTESCAIRFMNVSEETCRNLRDQNVCVKQMDWPAFISVMEIGRHTSTAF